MAINFPDINPVILAIGETPFKITWYSLSYVVGIILCWLYVRFLNKNIIHDRRIDDLITYIILGIIIGGRLGYVIFYDLSYNLAHPLNIVKTWQGGMSFHGGLIGVVTAMYIFARNNKIPFFEITDLVACATPIGLFFGRIANFINAELYGRATDISWGVIFPDEKIARHPSQIYEALTEGLITFIIMYLIITYTKARQYKGFLSGTFLLLYAFFRSLIENYREPDEHIGFIFWNITMGQILSAPMIIFGLLIIFYSFKQKND